MLQHFSEDIWIANGSTVAVFGFRYPTRMAVIKLANGTLLVWSPIQLSRELRDAVDALGPVKHLVAPNALHHLHLTDWRHAYPGAKLYAPPGLRQKRPDITFDADLSSEPPTAWVNEIDQVLVTGNAITTEIVFFHRKSATVLFTDLIQGFPVGWFTGWRSFVARLDLMVGPEPQVPRKFRAAFVNRRAARIAIQQILAWPAERVLMAHGDPIRQDARRFLVRAFRWLTGDPG